MRAIPFAVAALAMLVAKEAAAEDLRLSWRAPAGCPSSEHVRDAALRSAGTDAAREPLEAEARVEHGDRWRVTILTTRNGTPSAERRLEAASCAALADATAVILAIAMIPAGRAVETTGAREGERDADAKAKTDADADAKAKTDAKANADADARARAEAEEGARGHGDGAGAGGGGAAREAERIGGPNPAYAHGFAGSVAGATDGTTLPSAALGVRLGLAWTPRRARIEIGGSYFSAQSKTTDASLAGARFTLLVAGGRACWAVLQGSVEIAPCAGADVQVMKAKGFGASQNYDAKGTWMSATGGVLVRVPLLPWLALRADADAIVPITRPRFVVEGEGAVHRPSAIGARAGIGAELLFL